MRKPLPTVVTRPRRWQSGWALSWTFAVTMTAIASAWVVALPAVAAPSNVVSPDAATAQAPVPAEVLAALPSARLLGRSTLRFFGLAIYEARLWVPPGFAPARYEAQPFALELHYARKLDGAAIAERSLTEMRRVGEFSLAQATAWLEQLKQAIPDVNPGDRLTGVSGAAGVTHFYSNGRLTSSIADPEFSRLFFGIWLSVNTSEPTLRRALIGQKS